MKTKTRTAREDLRFGGCEQASSPLESFVANALQFPRAQFTTHSNEQLVRAGVLRIRRLAQDLGDAHLKVLLGNVLPTLAKGVHACEERSAMWQGDEEREGTNRLRCRYRALRLRCSCPSSRREREG